jgi:PST family polysaccharide transporter
MSGIKKNISYLILVQAVMYLAPLLTLPYLTRTLDVANFAAMGFIQSVVQYFILVTDYGFGITATRVIAIHKEDKDKVSGVAANTIAVKLLLALVCALLGLLLVALFADIRSRGLLLAACFIGVIGNAVFPTWLFQGLEQMQPMALIACVSRVLPLPLIFLLVKKPDDVIAAAILQNVPGVIAALLSLYYLFSRKLVGKAAISAAGIKEMLVEGWPVFLSNISTSFYTSINLILLKIFAGTDQVAYFAATDKIRVAAQGFIQPIASALFPRIAAWSQDPDKAGESRALIKKGATLLIGLQLLGALVMYGLADQIAYRYLGKSFAPAAIYLKSLALLPAIIAVAAIVSQWRFLALGHSRVLSRIYLIAGPLHAVYASWLTWRYQATGLIVSLYLTEVAITAAMIALARKKRIPLF